MKVFIESANTSKKVAFRGTVKELLEKLGINPETVLVAKNNELVTEDEKLGDEDEIALLSVISGG